MNNHKQISKLMSLVLRHQPEAIGIKLDEHGWAKVSDLLHGINSKGLKLDMPLLEEIVKTNPKKRFSFNEAKTLVRANQGHSISVDVQLNEKEPPYTLYHGTVAKYMSSIREKGLLKMNRNHVHLSQDIETASIVGQRRGKPIILKINAHKMSLAGFKFFLSENNVWLTETVPTEFINFDE